MKLVGRELSVNREDGVLGIGIGFPSGSLPVEAGCLVIRGLLLLLAATAFEVFR